MRRMYLPPQRVLSRRLTRRRRSTSRHSSCPCKCALRQRQPLGGYTRRLFSKPRIEESKRLADPGRVHFGLWKWSHREIVFFENSSPSSGVLRQMRAQIFRSNLPVIEESRERQETV